MPPTCSNEENVVEKKICGLHTPVNSNLRQAVSTQSAQRRINTICPLNLLYL